MYCERSTMPLVTSEMRRIGRFLVVMCVMFCGSTWGAVTVVHGPTEVPWDGITPSGLVDLWLWGSESELVNDEYLGYIGSSVLSGSDSYDDAYLDGEVGLWYAEGNVHLGTVAAFGRSLASALAHFSIDGSQLSIHWKFDVTTNQSEPGFTAPIWTVYVVDDVSGGLGWWYTGHSTGEGTEILDLVPGGVYRLYWYVDVDVWEEYGSYSQATLTLDLIDLGGGGGGSDEIMETIDFFDDSVEAEELDGQGPARSADKRLNALRNMLENAAVLIEGDFYEEACDQLWDAYGKCDGDSEPPDLVTGGAAVDLAQMILEVIHELGCE